MSKKSHRLETELMRIKSQKKDTGAYYIVGYSGQDVENNGVLSAGVEYFARHSCTSLMAVLGDDGQPAYVHIDFIKIYRELPHNEIEELGLDF